MNVKGEHVEYCECSLLASLFDGWINVEEESGEM